MLRTPFYSVQKVNNQLVVIASAKLAGFKTKTKKKTNLPPRPRFNRLHSVYKTRFDVQTPAPSQLSCAVKCWVSLFVHR